MAAHHSRLVLRNHRLLLMRRVVMALGMTGSGLAKTKRLFVSTALMTWGSTTGNLLATSPRT